MLLDIVQWTPRGKSVKTRLNCIYFVRNEPNHQYLIHQKYLLQQPLPKQLLLQLKSHENIVKQELIAMLKKAGTLVTQLRPMLEETLI